MFEKFLLESRSDVDSVVQLLETLFPWIVVFRLFDRYELVLAYAGVKQRRVVFEHTLVQRLPTFTQQINPKVTFPVFE